ncbi:hypothetical protein [Dendronalium sp. ChiSLP03b]|uniref:hypothetical protein n=1 Tax=Dendronalium sp. ChiSLP03b TaxID=3075381 RepID=UPI002AD36B68|nr:hypothetical protein [Dendronalium sp. ChiSLP03b]MDZ8204640.1 hypothetical protein [Dendronalium sp. ChiSLP03b]
MGFHATSYPAGRRSAYNGGNPPSGSQFLQVGEAAQRTAHRNGVTPQVEELPLAQRSLNPRPRGDAKSVSESSSVTSVTRTAKTEPAG